jgi:hypothetical protein
MKETKRKVTGVQYVMLLFLIVGIILLFINRDGSDKLIKINWGMGVGLIVGSVSYFVDWTAKVFVMWKEKISMSYTTFLLIAGFVVLFFGSDCWRGLGLGTVLTAGGITYFGTHIATIQKYFIWILIVSIKFVIVVFLWSLIDGLIHHTYTTEQIILSFIGIIVLLLLLLYYANFFFRNRGKLVK